jgi:hypothetical protein
MLDATTGQHHASAIGVSQNAAARHVSGRDSDDHDLDPNKRKRIARRQLRWANMQARRTVRRFLPSVQKSTRIDKIKAFHSPNKGHYIAARRVARHAPKSARFNVNAHGLFSLTK